MHARSRIAVVYYSSVSLPLAAEEKEGRRGGGCSVRARMEIDSESGSAGYVHPVQSARSWGCAARERPGERERERERDAEVENRAARRAVG